MQLRRGKLLDFEVHHFCVNAGTLFHQFPTGLMVVDAETFRIITATAAACSDFEFCPRSAREYYLHEIFVNVDDWRTILKRLGSGDGLDGTVLRLRSFAGRPLRVVGRFSMMATAGRRYLLSGFHDVSSLLEQAVSDNLTSLPSRASFYERMPVAVRQATTNGREMAFVFIDLDDFKLINDRYGHEFGDRVLSEVANRIRESLRPVDQLFRWGGDEFIAVLTFDGSLAAIAELLDRIGNALALPLVLQKRLIRVGCSIGVSRYPQHGTDVNRLIALADQAMYAAKACGKNRRHMYDRGAI